MPQIKCFHDNLVDNAVLSSAKVASGFALADVESGITGHRVRLIQTLYIHSSGALQNDALDFNHSSTDYNATLSAGTYSLDELCTEIVSAMETADGSSGDWSCSVNALTNKFEIVNSAQTFTLEWSTGANAATTCGDDLGADTTSDQTATGAGPWTATFANTAPHDGQWFKADATALSGLGVLAVAYHSLYAVGGPKSALPFTDTNRPSSVYLTHYSHTSDLGDDPRLWSASATSESSGDVTGSWTDRDENSLGMKIYSAATTSRNWHYFLFHDNDGALNNFPTMELGLLGLYETQTVLGGSANRTYQAERNWTMVMPYKAPKVDASASFGIIHPTFWRLSLPLEEWPPDAVEGLLDLAQTLGRRTPACWVIDDTQPNDGLTAFWAIIDSDIGLSYIVNDWASHNLRLRQQR